MLNDKYLKNLNYLITCTDAKILVEGILDMSLNVSKYDGRAMSKCPLCGKRSDTLFDIENFIHDKECAYLVAMKLHNELGMDDE